MIRVALLLGLLAVIGGCATQRYTVVDYSARPRVERYSPDSNWYVWRPVRKVGYVVVENIDVIDFQLRIESTQEVLPLPPGGAQKVTLPRGLHRLEILAEVEPKYWKRIADKVVEINAATGLRFYCVQRAGWVWTDCP